MDKPIKNKKIKFGLIIGIIILTILMFYFLYQIIFIDNSPVIFLKKEDIKITPVEIGAFQEYIHLTGFVIPGGTIYIDSNETGHIEEVFVEQGDNVTSNQPILTIENNDLEINYSIKETQILEKKYELESYILSCDKQKLVMEEQLLDLNYNLELLELDYSNNKVLYESGAITYSVFFKISKEFEYWNNKRDLFIQTRNYENLIMEQNIKRIKVSIDLLNTELRKIRNQINKLTIISPVTGQITELIASIGETKYVGSRIVQIALTDTYKIKAIIDEYYLSRTTIGSAGTFTVKEENNNEEKVYNVSIIYISPEVKDNNFEVELVFNDDVPQDIRIGQSFLIQLKLSESNEALIVKKGTFFQSTGGNWIYVVNNEGTKAFKRHIEIGRQNPEYLEIISGLEKGENVIISSYDNFNNENEVLELN